MCAHTPSVPTRAYMSARGWVRKYAGLCALEHEAEMYIYIPKLIFRGIGM